MSLGAFAFAAIGAERELRANLPAASLYAGSATAIGAVAIIAAFEGLATIYLPQTKSLFVLMTIGTAVGGAILIVLALGDAYLSVLPTHWLGTQEKAYRAAIIGSTLVTLSLGAGSFLYFDGAHIAVGAHATHWLVGIGILLSLITGLGSMFRTMNSTDRWQGPITKSEAWILISGLVSYLLILLLAMP